MLTVSTWRKLRTEELRELCNPTFSIRVMILIVLWVMPRPIAADDHSFRVQSGKYS